MAEGKIVALDQVKKRVEVSAFELDNPLVFEYFSDRVAAEDYDEVLFRALYIGILALQEDRLASFFAKTENELGTHLESLKAIFDMKKEIFFKSVVKGLAAETDVIAFLENFFKRRQYSDVAEASGTKPGAIRGNKTGDILCSVKGGGCDIAIEVKFDKSYRWGDFEDKDIFVKKADTAWSQIIEAKANRDARVGIIVFDRSLVDKSITEKIESVGFVKGIGFIAIVDSMRGDYSNLAIAYELARDLVLADCVYNAENDTLALLVKRLLHDIGNMLSVTKQCDAIDKASKTIRDTLDKNLLSFQFTLKYLEKFKTSGELTAADLLAFYNGEEVKDKFKSLGLEKEIK